MDNSANLPAGHRIGGLYYTYSHDPEDLVEGSFRVTEHYDSPVFSLSVGPSKTAYLVHQEVLCKSPVFGGLCTSGLKESQTKHIEMPEDDPVVVGHLIDFLYEGHYLPGEPVGDELANLLAKLYIAADKYMVDDLKEMIVDDLEDEWCLPSLTEGGFLEVSEFIYCNVSESDDCFRELFTDMACDRFEIHTFFFHTRKYLSSTTAFVDDLFEAQHRARVISEERHNEKHEIDKKRLDGCTKEACVHRQYLLYTKEDHDERHPKCTKCDMWEFFL